MYNKLALIYDVDDFLKQILHHKKTQFNQCFYYKLKHLWNIKIKTILLKNITMKIEMWNFIRKIIIRIYFEIGFRRKGKKFSPNNFVTKSSKRQRMCSWETLRISKWNQIIQGFPEKYWIMLINFVN